MSITLQVKKALGERKKILESNIKEPTGSGAGRGWGEHRAGGRTDREM